MIGDEKFNAGEPIKLFVSNVASGTKGANIIVSRASEGFLKCLFTEDVYEINIGTIVIKGVAREAGERSKVAVYTDDPNIDPAGACIGPNGSRIQKIVSQLGNGQSKEKIDIIGYSEIPGLYIIEALKPARVVGIVVDEENKSATAIVKDDSLSLAIGKKGVNARLAVRLTGYNIDIKTETQAEEEGIEFVTFEELQAQDAELKSKKAYEKLAAQYQSSQESSNELPKLEGYVAPQERVYSEEDSNEELNEALEEASEKEEIVKEIKKLEVKEEQPKVEEVKAPVEEAPVVEEKKAVKTTTSLEDLEKSLSEESNKQVNKNNRRSNKKKKDEAEEENSKGALDTSSAERMSIYTEEELREMEEEERQEEEDYDEDVDYDDYDEYYDDDDR